MADIPLYALRVDSALRYKEEPGELMYALLAGEAILMGTDMPNAGSRCELALLLPMESLQTMRICSQLRKKGNPHAPPDVATLPPVNAANPVPNVDNLDRRVTMRRQQTHRWFFDLAEQCDLKLLDYTLKLIEGTSMLQPDGSPLPVFIVHCETDSGPLGVLMGADATRGTMDYLLKYDGMYAMDHGMFAKRFRSANPQVAGPKSRGTSRWWKRLWS